MKDKHYCQSCNMPLDNPKFMGTEMDGSLNKDYCIYCYRHGAFTHPNITLQEMKSNVIEQMNKMKTPANIIDATVKNLPTLKRWASKVQVL